MAKESKWQRGVREYAQEIKEMLDENGLEATQENMLNGARDWAEYSGGGCSLIYDQDIAERLATSTELKRTDNGRLNPNSRETWLDCQARALYQASKLLEK